MKEGVRTEPTPEAALRATAGDGVKLDHPKRPSRFDMDVARKVAADLIPAIAEWGDGEPADDLIEPLARELRWRSDGYELANALERFLTPDAQLVEILDGHRAWWFEREAVKAWVAEHGITIPFALGDTVKTRQGVGEVVKLEPETAQINVRTPDQKPTSAWIICVEDAEPA